MPHFAELPPWLRAIGRVARVATYLLIVLVGAGDLLFPPERFPGPDQLIDVWGAFMIVVGTLALVAVIFRRWRVEWVCSFWLGAAVALRAVVVWAAPGPPPPLADGGLATVVALSLILRGLDLTVFHRKTTRAVRLAKS